MATEEYVQRLKELNVIEVNGGYDYTDDYKETIREYLKGPLGYYAKLRLSTAVAKQSGRILKDTRTFIFWDKPSVEYLNTVILFFVNYVQKRGKKKILKDKEISNILYALYCLDQKIPDVEV